MSISRVKPRTERATEQAINAAKQRMDSVAPADQALTPTTQTAVTNEKTTITGLIATATVKKYLMLKATTAVDKAKTLARNFVNAYFQVFNVGINLLGVFDKESRVFYSIAESDNRVPVLSSEADILYWGEKVVSGETARVAAGGAAMLMPTAADVNTNVADFNTKNNDQGNKKINYQAAQALVTAEMPNAIQVVTKVWDEVETFYDQLEINAMRQKAREWGVVYESDVKITINVAVKNKTTGAMLAGALTTVIESGTEHTSDAAGNEVIETNIAFGVTLETELENYVTNTLVVDFETGVTVYTVVVEMMPV